MRPPSSTRRRSSAIPSTFSFEPNSAAALTSNSLYEDGNAKCSSASAALSGGGVQKITLLALSDERTQQNSQNKEKDAEPGRDDALSGNLVTSLDDHDGTCGQMITALSASHHVSVSTQACNQLKPTLASPNSVVAQLENSASKSASRAVTVQYPGSAKTVAWPFMGVSDVCTTDKYLRCNRSSTIPTLASKFKFTLMRRLFPNEVQKGLCSGNFDCEPGFDCPSLGAERPGTFRLVAAICSDC